MLGHLEAEQEPRGLRGDLVLRVGLREAKAVKLRDCLQPACLVVCTVASRLVCEANVGEAVMGQTGQAQEGYFL